MICWRNYGNTTFRQFHQRGDSKCAIERVSDHATGLTAVGTLLSKTNLSSRLQEAVLPENPNPDISNADVMKSYLGLLCQGKSDFDHIEPFRHDDAFSISLDIRNVPSSPTLRQRLGMAGISSWKEILLEESAYNFGF